MSHHLLKIINSPGLNIRYKDRWTANPIWVIWKTEKLLQAFEPVWMLWEKKKKSIAPDGDRSPAH
jgi:hypothetical protein